MCTRRRLRAYARQPSYNLMRPGTSLIMALMFASVFAPNTRNLQEVVSDVTAVAIGAFCGLGICVCTSSITDTFPLTPQHNTYTHTRAHGQP